VLATALLAVTLAGPALAAAAKISLNPDHGPPTSLVTVKGTGFGSNETVLVDFDGSQVTAGATDGSGSFSAPFYVPSYALPGPNIVLALGTQSGRQAEADFDVRTDWSRFHFDAASLGKNTSENVVGIENVTDLVKRWSFQSGGMIRSSPVVAGHVVYVGSDDGSLYALKADDGAYLWSRPIGGAVESVPAVDTDAGIVYVGSDDHSLYALDAGTGSKIWSFKTGGAVISSPDLSGGIVYFGSLDGSMYAVDTKDGSKVWSYKTGGAIQSAPAVWNGDVYFGSFDGSVYALNAKNGKLDWSRATDGPIEASPGLATYRGDDDLIVGSDDHTIYELDANTGAVRWRYVTPGDVYSSPAISVSEGFLFIGTHNWNIESHRIDSGKLRWWYSCPQGQAVYSSPAVANGIVYYGCRNGYVYALFSSVRHPRQEDIPDRLPVWSFKTHGPIYSSPAVSDGMVYIGSDDGALYAFGLP
jgi:eukaryotic-like serine/threonine-protein kinase